MNIVRREPYKPAMVRSFDLDPLGVFRDLVRWDPFLELSPLFASTERRETLFVPDIDVKETPEAYLFTADLPGIKEKDVEIEMAGNRLTISGKREEEHREEKETYYTCERSYGSFSRSFTLPEGTNVELAKAEMKDGVLSVSVPKVAEVKARSIPVQATSKV